MTENPLVSIICLNYNHEKYVTQALDSVIRQSYKKIEFIIVDDCSTDDSVVIIEKWLGSNTTVLFIKNDTNLGSTKSFNKAAKLAKGDYLIDLAADDILLPCCVEKQIQSYQSSSYKNLGLVYGNIENINEDGCFNSYYYSVHPSSLNVIHKRESGSIYRSIINSGATICSPSAMYKKTVFDLLGGYDENLVYEDLDFWIRLARNYEIEFIDSVLVQKRIVESSLGSQFYSKSQSQKINQSTYIILKKALLLNENKEENKTLLKRVHYEIILNLKNRNYNLVFKLLFLKFKIEIQNLFF